MSATEIINLYWKDLLIRVSEYKYSTKIVKYIIHKCFNSEHPLNTINIENDKLIKFIICAYTNYAKVGYVDNYISKISLKQYPTSYQNALYESDKEYLYTYIHKSKELLVEIYNQHVFLKPYTDICKLQYYCKKIIKIMDRLLEAIEYVPVIPDKLNSN
jgi:hypothetical protein